MRKGALIPREHKSVVWRFVVACGNGWKIQTKARAISRFKFHDLISKSVHALVCISEPLPHATTISTQHSCVLSVSKPICAFVGDQHYYAYSAIILSSLADDVKTKQFPLSHCSRI